MTKSFSIKLISLFFENQKQQYINSFLSLHINPLVPKSKYLWQIVKFQIHKKLGGSYEKQILPQFF